MDEWKHKVKRMGDEMGRRRWGDEMGRRDEEIRWGDEMGRRDRGDEKGNEKGNEKGSETGDEKVRRIDEMGREGRCMHLWSIVSMFWTWNAHP